VGLAFIEITAEGVAAMQPVKIILVPTDFSPPSKRALRYACSLADATGASLHIIHVMENPYMPDAFAGYYAPLPGEFVEDLDRRTRAELESQLTPEEKTRYSAVFVLRMGAPAHEILDYLQNEAAIDLVVMATSGRGGVARLMIGSVADKIVRSAPCPVLTLHPTEHTAAGTTYRAA
jgi:nucleotide-binding universal stress UspA family protein